eukprot:193365_1
MQSTQSTFNPINHSQNISTNVTSFNKLDNTHVHEEIKTFNDQIELVELIGHHQYQKVKSSAPIEQEEIIRNVSVSIGFLLHENSPLWDTNRKHPDISDNSTNSQNKTNQYSFTNRCSIFQSKYVSPIDIERKHEQFDYEHTFNQIMSDHDIDEKSCDVKWNELIQFWDSWQLNKNIQIKQYNSQLRFEWNKYADKITQAEKYIDKLIHKLSNFGTLNSSEKNDMVMDIQKLNELEKVSNKADMEKWLDKYKKWSDLSRKNTICSSLVCKSTTLNQDVDIQRIQFINNLPMQKWSWKNVVFWIQQNDQFKDFASIFYDWQINGNELLQMNKEQIKLLGSCCYQTVTLNEEVAEALVIEIKKQMINSIITYNYGICYDIIKTHHDSKILQLLRYLRPRQEQGPNALWKLDAFYFSKVDNILAILLAPKQIQEIFKELNPQFIFDNNHNIHQKEEYEKKTLSQSTSNPAEASETITTVSKQDSVATRYVDVIDRLSNKCNCVTDNACGEYIRNFDRVYLKVICICLVALSFGCLIVWYWMSIRSRSKFDISMRWTAESIAARAIQKMEYEFFIPQMISNIVVAGLYTGDISINTDNYIHQADFDEFFVQFKQYKTSETSIFSICMHESAHNTLICGSDAGTTIIIFNGTCLTQYQYNDITKQRSQTDSLILTCTYNPQTRPWYYKAKQLNLNDFGWSQPYVFASETSAIGISLVTRLLHQDIEVVFLVEFTTTELQNIFKAIGSVSGGVTYLATSDGSIIASSIGQHDLNVKSVDCPGIECFADDELLINSISVLRANDAFNIYNGTLYKYDDFIMTVVSFSTTYLSGTNLEYGTIVVVYGNEHLSKIKNAEIYTMIIFVFSLIVVFITLCGMASYLTYLQEKIKRKNDPSGSAIHSRSSIEIHDQILKTFTSINPPTIRQAINKKDKEYLSTKHDSYLINSYCILDHRLITICSFWYILAVFSSIFYIWQESVGSTLGDTTELFFKEEYLIIEDKVADIVIIADGMIDIISEQLKFNKDNMNISDWTQYPNIPTELDVLFSSVMNSFKQPNGDYYANMIYMSTPDGKFVGTQPHIITDHNGTQHIKGMEIHIRDNSTDWEYKIFASDEDTSKRINISHPMFKYDIYDGRCRPWYQNTMAYMIDTDIIKAFGTQDNFFDFYTSDLPARSTDACDNAIAYYMDIWNITNVNATKMDTGTIPNELYLNNVLAKNISYNMIWSQYLFFSGTFGITASKPVINELTGELLAVVAVDFGLAGMSEYLGDTNNLHVDEGSWFSWIFNGDSNHQIIASSDHNITISPTEIEGCIHSDTSYSSFPYLATEHPERFIRIMSKEIILFYLQPNRLPINSSFDPKHISLPIDFPDALSGRFITYPFSNQSKQVSLDWIIAKSIDIRNFQGAENDDITIIAFVLSVLLLVVYFIQRNLSISTIKTKKLNADTKSSMVASLNEKKDKNLNIQLLDELSIIVERATIKEWNSFKQQTEDQLTSASVVHTFLAKQSNKFIQAANDYNDSLLTFYALKAEDKYFMMKLLNLVLSRKWNILVITTILVHLSVSFYLPSTPTMLQNFEYSTVSAKVILCLLLLTVFIELIDVALHFIKRYILFGRIGKLKYNFEDGYVATDEIRNKSFFYLVFFGGAHWKLFLIHICLVSLILINITTMIFWKFGIFEYYVPVVPILLSVRCETIRKFSNQFFYAIYLARDVLVAYFFFILFVSIIGFAVFSNIVNPNQSTDSYQTSIRALITSFVFVTSGQNYDEIVHPTVVKTSGYGDGGEMLFSEIDNTISIINLLLLLTISIFGLYFFVPVLVYKFGLAFKNIRTQSMNRYKQVKINNIISAFILLDFEKQRELSIDMLKSGVLFDVNNKIRSDEQKKISLNEFISALTNQTSITVSIDPIRFDTSRLQAFLECNWCRTRKSRHYFLLCILIPSLCVALVHGLVGNDVDILEVLIHIAFGLNFIDINLRWYAFGGARYWSLSKYENPPLIQQSIYNWHIDWGLSYTSNTVRLSYSSKEWCRTYLRSVKPLSHWNKIKLTGIHRFELCLIWLGTMGIVFASIFPKFISGYYYFFVQCYLFRLFTLVEYKASQSVFDLMFTITPQFLRLLAFLFIFIFIWARVGCTMFAHRTE